MLHEDLQLPERLEPTDRLTLRQIITMNDAVPTRYAVFDFAELLMVSVAMCRSSITMTTIYRDTTTRESREFKVQTLILVNSLPFLLKVSHGNAMGRSDAVVKMSKLRSRSRRLHFHVTNLGKLFTQTGATCLLTS